MKRTILVLVLISLFTSLSQAQIYKGFGVKVGTSIANQTGSSEISSEKTIPDFRYKFGFTGGVFKETRLIEKLNLVIGVNYIQKGALDEFPSTSETGQYLGMDYIQRNFNFMNIEILAKYNGNINNYFPYILAGLRMDVFISADYTLNGNKLINYHDGIPINNNKTFGGVVGLGFEYKSSKLISLFIEGTYNPDFTNLYEQTDSYGRKNYLKGNSFDIRTGVKF